MKKFKQLQQRIVHRCTDYTNSTDFCRSLRQGSKKNTKISLLWRLAISLVIISVVFVFGNSFVKSQDTAEGDFTVEMDITTSSTGYTEGEDLAVFIDWTTSEENDYGYKVEREYQGEKEDVLILNPFPLGIDNLSNGGQFLDDDVKLGETYTYYIYAFDRTGDVSKPVSTTVTVTREEFEKANLCDPCLDDEVQENNE